MNFGRTSVMIRIISSHLTIAYRLRMPGG